MSNEDTGSAKRAAERLLETLASAGNQDHYVPGENEFLDAAGNRIKVDFENKACLVQPPISRRAFLGMAAALGGLTALDSIAGGAIHAYADDASDADYGFVISVISKEEVGLIAADVSGGSQQTISDMQVKVTSLFNGATVEGKTDQYGRVILNVKKLAEQQDDSLSRYEFWGSVYAHKDGYRDYETGKVRIVSGPPVDKKGVPVYTQKNDGKPYARLASYDGFDIQYAPTTIAVVPGNDADHTVHMKVAGPQGKQITAILIHDGAEKQRATKAIDGQTGVALFEFKGRFSHDFIIGKETKLQFIADQTTYEMKTKLICEAGIIEAANMGDVKISPGGGVARIAEDGTMTEEVAGYSYTLPKDLPIVGGTKLDLDLPMCPFWGYIGPFGDMAFMTNFQSQTLFNSEKGGWNKDNWKFISKESKKAWEDRTEDGFGKAIQRYTDAQNNKLDKNAKTGSADKFGGMQIKFSFDALAMGNWIPGKKLYDAQARVTLGLAFKYSLTKQFVIGPFPVFFGFDIGLAVQLIFSIGMTMAGFFTSINWRTGNVGATIVTRFEIGVTAGIGIAGFLSVSVRGYGYVTASLGFVLPPDNKPFPHVQLAAGAGVDYALQALFFTAKGSIYGKKWDKLVDNWSSSSGELPAAQAMPGYPEFGTDADSIAGGSVVNPLPGDDGSIAVEDIQWKIIPNDVLEGVVEATATVTDLEEDLPEYSMVPGFLQDVDCSPVGILDPESAEVEDYDIIAGVRPTTEAAIFKGIVSDSRPHVIQVGDAIYLLKLAIVKVADGLISDYYASRIQVSKYDGSKWTEPKTIDFTYVKTDHKRKNFYDYDFDVAATGNILHITLISGYRQSAFWNSRRYMIGAYLTYDVSTGQISNVTPYYDAYDKGDGENYLTLEYPKVIPVSKEAGSFHTVANLFFESHVSESTNASVKVVAFATWRNLDGSADSEGAFKVTGLAFEGAVSDIQASAGSRPYGAYRPTVLIGATYPAQSADSNIGRYQMRTIDKYNKSFEVSLSHGDQLLYGAMTPNFNINTRDMESGFYLQTRQIPQTGESIISHVVNTGGEGSGALKAREVGKIDQNASLAVGPDGKWLFTTHVMKGSSGSDIEPGSTDAEAGETMGTPTVQFVELYQIMGAKKYRQADRFSELFPIAQLQHAADSLDVLSFSQASTGFLFSSITDLKKAKADLYFASIPWVKSLQLIGVTCLEEFAGIGDTCHLALNVHNAGNVGLSGFKAWLCADEAGKDRIVELPIENLKESLIPSLAHHSLETGEIEIDAADAEGVLLPGRERVYASSFKIPAGWKGTKTLYVVLDALQEATADRFTYGEDIPDEALVIEQLDAGSSDFTLAVTEDVALTLDGSANDYASWTTGDDSGKDKGGGIMAATSDGLESVTNTAIAALAAALGLGGIGLAGKGLKTHVVIEGDAPSSAGKEDIDIQADAGIDVS